MDGFYFSRNWMKSICAKSDENSSMNSFFCALVSE